MLISFIFFGFSISFDFGFCIGFEFGISKEELDDCG